MSAAVPTPAVPLPIQEAVRDLFGDLLSRGCAVDKADEPLALGSERPGVVAIFVDAEDEVAAVALADVALACHAGAALVMVPQVVAQEAVAAGRVDDEMLDCYREVTNVLTRLLNSPETPHVKLHALKRTGELIPGGVRALLAEPAARKDFLVSVEGYGEGRLALAVS